MWVSAPLAQQPSDPGSLSLTSVSEHKKSDFRSDHMAAAGIEVISAIHFYYVILSIKRPVFWSGLASADFKNIKADSNSALKTNTYFNYSAVTGTLDETNFKPKEIKIHALTHVTFHSIFFYMKCILKL